MRQFLLSAALAATLTGLAPSGVAAQDFSPVIYVNNAAVTNYELNQRMRFMEVLSSPEQGRDAAETALIDDRLRIEAARQLGVEVSEVGLEQGLAEFAGRAGMTTGQFVEVLAKNGVERQAYRDFVKAGVAWREVVRQRVVPRITVSDAEVDQALRRIVETPRVTEVLMSELIMPIPPGQEAAVNARADEFASSIRSEAAFAEAARRYSATPTRTRGGRLEWMALENLPPTLRPIILGLKPGQITPPLNVPGAVVLFFLRDTKGELLPGAKDQTLDYLSVTYPSATEATNVAARARSCDELYVFANGLPDSQVRRQTGGQSAIPADISVRLASLDENESTVIDRGRAADVLMLCDRTPALIAGLDQGPVATADGDTAADPGALPRREAVQEQIFNEKVNKAADAYLAELRADAVIRRP